MPCMYTGYCIKQDTVVNHLDSDKHVQLIYGMSDVFYATTELRTIKWTRQELGATEAVDLINPLAPEFSFKF
jgi:hypothetical protein